MQTGQSLAFGTLLRRRRIAAGLTQEELAERAGVSARSIGDIERGVSHAPRRDTVALLAGALGLTPDESPAFEAAARRLDDRSPAVPQARSTSPTGIQPRPVGAPAPPFVGRTRELALLTQHLSGEGPPLLVLAGEPGIGKSRLLAEAVRDAEAAGRCVLRGGCQRRGGQEPYAPLLSALKSHIEGLSHTQMRAALVGCAWLVRLLPELSNGPIEPLPPWTLPPEQERRLMFEAVTRFVANLATPGGALLALDDLQWAGSDALDLLTSLVRVRDMPLRVLCAYRDTEVGPRDALSVTLADLAHADLAAQVALEPLARQDVQRLLDELLDVADGVGPESREQILQRAGGVPFFAVSCARAMRAGAAGGAGDAAVPWNLSQSIRQRVAVLPEAARDALSAAAVVGRVVPPAVLVRAIARPPDGSEEPILNALEAACQARLLVDMGHAYQFAHDVIREVIESDLATARRLVLHRRVATAVEDVYADHPADHYETLAFHYLQGEVWDKALHYLEKCGDKAAAAGAIQEALGYYDRALALCDRLGTPAQMASVALARKRGTLLFDGGDFAGAATDYERMRIAAVRLEDRHNEGMALAYRGFSQYYGHDFEGGETTLRTALELAGTDDADAGLLASISLASLLAVTNRYAEATPLLSLAAGLAPRVHDAFSRSWWAISACEFIHWAGRYDEAIAFLEREQSAIEANRQIMLLLWCQWEEALARGGKGDYTRALALLEGVIAACERIGERFLGARALNTAGWLYCELHDHRRAIELNTQSLDVASTMEVSDAEIRGNARLNLGDSLMALGRGDEAEEHFRAVERVVRNPSPPERWMIWRYAQHLFHSYGELCLARGDSGRALAYADECLALAEPSESKKNVVKARRLRGQSFLMHGRVDEAEQEIERALEVARQIGNPPQLWKTYVALGDLQLAQGRAADADQTYRDALQIIDAVAADLTDTALRQTFLTSSHVLRIQHLAGPVS